MRLLPPDARRRVAPFLALGGGMVSYGLEEGTPVVTRESPFARVGGDRYGPVHSVMLTIGIHGLR